MNHTSGICMIQFKPDASDLGLWTCKFIINTDKGDFILGNSSLILVIKHTGIFIYLFQFFTREK